MASIGHVAVGMAAARNYDRQETLARRLLRMAAWSALSLLPDADVIGFRFGIRYADTFGHRGATHSLVLCLGGGLLIAGCAKYFGSNSARLAWYLSVVLVSHPLLDTLTDGGLGCALSWPFEQSRHFAPWRPIPVAPIGQAFFSKRGLSVALVELMQFAPLFIIAVWPRVRADRGVAATADRIQRLNENERDRPVRLQRTHTLNFTFCWYALSTSGRIPSRIVRRARPLMRRVVYRALICKRQPR